MIYPDYSFKSHFADIGGHRMHYVDEGGRDAPVLVLIHGNPGWSYYYRHIINALSADYRCIAPDHIGMGLSDKPTMHQYPFTLESRIRDLGSLLDSLGIDQDIRLMVHDWGGMIGMGYATRYPDRIKNLVVSNTAAFHLPAGVSLPWQLTLGRSFLAPFLIKGLNVFCRGAVKSCVTRRKMAKTTARAYLAPYNNWHNRHAVYRFVQDIPIRPGDESYETISIINDSLNTLSDRPTLLLWGMKDFVFTDAYLKIWSRKFPHALIHRYEDAGHYLLEDAHEEIIPILTDFLD